MNGSPEETGEPQRLKPTSLVSSDGTAGAVAFPTYFIRPILVNVEIVCRNYGAVIPGSTHCIEHLAVDNRLSHLVV